MDNPSLRYFEGVTDFVPGALHAWLVNGETVFDPTHPVPGRELQYFGVEIPTDYVMSGIAEGGEFRMLLPELDPALASWIRADCHWLGRE
jgi:hypothetical protein